MSTLSLASAQVNPRTGEKYLLIQWYTENEEIEQVIKPYDNCSQEEKDFIDAAVQFGTTYVPANV